MATIHSILTNFTAGELSPRLYGRVDIAKYQNGARELTNFLVLPQGGARKRGGSKFIAAIRAPEGYYAPGARLVEFTFSTTQAYILEFGHGYIRFFKDQGQIYNAQFGITGIDRGGATLIRTNGHSLHTFDRVIISGALGIGELNNREFVVSNDAASTTEFFIVEIDWAGGYHNVDSSGYGAWAGGGAVQRIHEVGTPYDAQTVSELTFTQSADTLYIFHRNWPIALLSRSSHTQWTLRTGVVEEGPFLDMNTDDANSVSVDVIAGVGIMTFSKPTLEEAHQGALFRIWEYANGETFGYATWAPGATVTVADGSFWEYKGNVYYVMSGGGQEMASTASYPTHTRGTADVFYGKTGGVAQMRYEHSGYAVVQVLDVVNTQQAYVEVVKNHVPYSAYSARSSLQWQEGAWSDKHGYPTVGTFHEQRLVAASTIKQPSTLWGSQVNAYLKFKDGDKDDEAYTYTISSDQVDAIKFMASTKRLAVMATGAEYIIQATAVSEAITPTNIKVSRETSFGTSNVHPVRAGPAILFAQRAGLNINPARRLREFVYNFQTDSYLAPDLTILSDHITSPGLVDGAFTATPDMQVWYAREDGVAVCVTYERDQQVVGWHKHRLGGSGLAVHMAAIPGENADELWMIVNRTISPNPTVFGGGVKYIEVLTHGLQEAQPVAESWFLDCALAYDGRTNLVPWSQDLNRWGKSWNSVAPEVTENAVLAPDGTMTADLVRLTPPSCHIFQYIDRNLIYTPGPYIASFYYKGKPGQVFYLLLNTDYGFQVYDAITIEDDQWHRHVRAYQYNEQTINWAAIGFVSFDAGDPVDIAFWGTQVEYGGFVGNDQAGIYRPTTDQALTGGGPLSSVSGLWHLNGEYVSALCDGVPVHNLHVSNGRVALPKVSSVVIVGYSYTSLLKTLHIEAGAQQGTAQGRIGRVYEIIARLHNSIGGKFGMDEDKKLDPIRYREADMALTPAVSLFNGDMVLPFDGDWDRDRYVTIQHDEPLPFTLTALMISQRVTG